MRNKELPASYRIALGQIKRYFGDSKPTEKEVKNIAVEIAKRNKLDDTEFFMKWALGQIGTVNEALTDDIEEIVKILKKMPTGKMSIKDQEPFRKWLKTLMWDLIDGKIQFSDLKK